MTFQNFYTKLKICFSNHLAVILIKYLYDFGQCTSIFNQLALIILNKNFLSFTDETSLNYQTYLTRHFCTPNFPMK